MNFMKIERPLIIVISVVAFLLLFAYVFYVSFLQKSIEERRSSRVGPDGTLSSTTILSNGTDCDDNDFLAKVMLRKELIRRNVFVRKIQRQESVRDLSQLLEISRGEVGSITNDKKVCGELHSVASDESGDVHSDGSSSGEGISRPLWRKCRRRRQDEPECSICLENYLPNDVIAWSKDGGEAETSNDNSIVSSKGCAHIFHKECLFAWLQDSDGCPLCRRRVVHADASVRFVGWDRVKV